MRSRRLRACLSAAVLSAATTLAVGAQARPFYLTSVGQDWLVIDPSSAESQPGAVVRRMWTVMVQRNIVDGVTPQPGYVRTQTDYDCVSRQVRWRTFSAYSRSGALLLTRENKDPAWREASSAPDILTAYRVACEGAGKSAVSAESIGRLVISLMATWDPPPNAKAAPEAPPQPLLAAPDPKKASVGPPAKPGAPPKSSAPAKTTAPAKAPPAKASTPSPVDAAKPAAGVAMASPTATPLDPNWTPWASGVR